jgi:hypothetical protein
MANEAWYVGKGGQQLGPFSTADLKAKLATGELSSADPVWKEGMAGWAAMGSLPDFAGAAPAAPPPPPMVYAPAPPSAVGKFFHDLFAGGTAEEAVSSPIVSLIEKLLGCVRFLGKRPEGFRRYQRLLTRIGCIALVFAGIVWLVAGIVGAIKSSSFSPVLGGLQGVLIAIVLHYVAAKFGNAGQQILAGEVHTMSSKALMDCLGLLSALGAIGALVSGVIDAVNYKAFSPLLPMLVACALLAHLAVFCLNPKECLNIEHDPKKARAGETALAILTFLYRCVLAVTPVVLGAGAAAGTVWAAFSMLGTWGSDVGAVMSAAAAYGTATQLVMMAGAAPLLAYVAYLLAMLGVEIAYAIFRIANNTARGSED